MRSKSCPDLVIFWSSYFEFSHVFFWYSLCYCFFVSFLLSVISCACLTKCLFFSDQYSSDVDVQNFFTALGSGSKDLVPEESAGGDDQVNVIETADQSGQKILS